MVAMEVVVVLGKLRICFFWVQMEKRGTQLRQLRFLGLGVGVELVR
jgi:hypothetical protein